MECNKLAFFLLFLIINIVISNCTELNEYLLSRERRQLLYRNVSVLQFNVGMVIPLSLTDRVINLNLFFQCNFGLPVNVSEVAVGTLGPGLSFAKRSYSFLDSLPEVDEDDKCEAQDISDDNQNMDDVDEYDIGPGMRLHHVYKHLEEYLDSSGKNGSACVRRMLCEASAEPLHTDDPEDFIHEMITYLLRPSNVEEESGEGALDAEEKLKADSYLEASFFGSSRGNCEKVYSTDCDISLLDLVSKLHTRSA